MIVFFRLAAFSQVSESREKMAKNQISIDTFIRAVFQPLDCSRRFFLSSLALFP